MWENFRLFLWNFGKKKKFLKDSVLIIFFNAEFGRKVHNAKHFFKLNKFNSFVSFFFLILKKTPSNNDNRIEKERMSSLLVTFCYVLSVNSTEKTINGIASYKASKGTWYLRVSSVVTALCPTLAKVQLFCLSADLFMMEMKGIYFIFAFYI